MKLPYLRPTSVEQMEDFLSNFTIKSVQLLERVINTTKIFCSFIISTVKFGSNSQRCGLATI